MKKIGGPPVFASWILNRFLQQYNQSPALGDLEEEFDVICVESGLKRARRWYRWQVYKSLPSLIKHSIYWSFAMFKNYLKTTIRNIIKHKGYSLINIVGLTLGLALFILIASYVQFEFSFDKFHKNYDRIYRVEVDFDGKGQLLAFSHVPLGPVLVKEYPEFLQNVRILNMGPNQLLSYNEDIKFYEGRGWWAENTFFDIFSYRLIHGDPKTALIEPFSIVLSQDLAEKYFPGENPLGKIIRFNNNYDCTVTGIIENCPENSHIQYNYLISYSSYKTIVNSDYFNEWHRIANFNYVILSEQASLSEINEKIRDVIRKNFREDVPSHVYLKPLSQFHFHSNILGDVGPRGDLNKITIFSAIGLFILLIACINFMNLSTARSAQRAKEVGLRKVVGASRFNLIRQFLGESLLFSFTALLLSFILAALLLPEFNSIIQRAMPVSMLANGLMIIGMVAITLFVGLLAGSYPALILSNFQPVNILKTSHRSSKRHTFIRKTLVVFQFVISICLIVGTLIIYQQMNFMKNKKLGYTKENILVTEFRQMDAKTIKKYETMKNELLKYPNISNISISRHIPSFNGSSFIVLDWKGSQADDKAYINLNYVDNNYLETYGISLSAGRNFFENETGDSTISCIINETAAKRFGWEMPIGKRLGGNIYVVGIVRDFHFASLRDEIQPMLLYPLREPISGSRARNQFSIKISPQNIDETLKLIRAKYEALFPQDIFEYRFYDEDIDRMYRSEKRTAKTITYFSVLAIFIACLGLFGLASFTAEQRTKEIGIRKVIGATVPNIITLLAKEFTRWVLVANIIAWPIAYYAMNKWLQEFAYRTNIGIWIFVVSAVMTLIIALFTVSYQAIRAALTNPVDSLKYE